MRRFMCLGIVLAVNGLALPAFAQPGIVLINEIMYDDTATTDIEWVELFNTQPFAVPVGDWVLTDGNGWPPPSTEGAIQIPPGVLISPLGYLVISKTPLPGIASVICAEFDLSWALNNNGDNLALYNGASAAAQLIDGSLLTMYPDLSASNAGNSLEKCNQLQPWTDDPAAWHESTMIFSTTGRYRKCSPGMPNSPCAPHGRCCFGELGIDCADVTEGNCTQLGGIWNAALNCISNPCIPCVCTNLETEPNNTPFTANPLPLGGNTACVRGRIENPEQLDVFSFVLAAPSRVTAFVRANDDPATCAFQGGLNAAVGLQVIRNGQAFFLEAASAGHIGQDPRLEHSFVLDPGEYFIAVGSDSGSNSIGPWVMDIAANEVIDHSPVNFGFGDLTIWARPRANSDPVTAQDSVKLSWMPGIFAEYYSIEYAPNLDSIWQQIAATGSNSIMLAADTANTLGFYRVIARAPVNRYNHIQDYVGTTMYPPEDSLGLYPIRVDSIMMTAMPDNVAQIAYLVGTFTGPIAPGFLGVTVRWDDRQDLFDDGALNIFSLDGRFVDIGNEPQIVDFARISVSSGDGMLAPLISHVAGFPSTAVLAVAAGGSGCKDHRGWKCEPKSINGVADCPPPPPYDPSPECAASLCKQVGDECVCEGTGAVICDIVGPGVAPHRRCFKAPFHDKCAIHTTCPATSSCEEYLVNGDVQRFFRYMFVDHCECIE